MRYGLTDREWAAIKPMLPNKARGAARVNDCLVLNGVFWLLRAGHLGPRKPVRSDHVPRKNSCGSGI